MKKMTKKMLAFLMAALMLVSLAACGSKNTQGSNGTNSTNGTAKTELNVRIPDAFSTLDPHGWNLDSDFRLCYQIYEPLYAVDDATNEIPVLATGYTISEEGTSYVFTIRDDVYFTNGDKLSASDVKFSIERAKASAYLAQDVATVDTVEADDAANTVTVNLTEPTPGLIEGLSYVLIANKKFVEENQDENGLLGFKACGTGPYMLKEYTQDVSVTMEANPNYRDGAPAIPTLKFHLIVDENTALTAFQAGEIDIARLNTTNWNNLKADSNYQTAELTTNHVTYIIMNVQKAPFDNQLVREAIACAVNREDMIAMVMDGQAKPTYTVVTPLMVGYAEIEPDYTYNTERAKELLAQAGYPNGLDVGEIQALSGTYFADAAVVLQQQLAEVGITCTISNLEANTLIANCMGGNFGMATMGQTNTYDMSWFATYYTTENIGGMNMAQYSNADIDAKIEAANICMDPKERIAMYKEIMETLDEECIYLPLYNKVTCMAWAKGLNYTPTVRMESYSRCSWN
ncbi:MAG: ABC transporter substrate-binding protein [Clostridiales bacterium]|nr:ABC transporter substrate-binding protein [Clostridiales bacterium]